jgi:hypothetical protein
MCKQIGKAKMARMDRFGLNHRGREEGVRKVKAAMNCLGMGVFGIGGDLFCLLLKQSV